MLKYIVSLLACVIFSNAQANYIVASYNTPNLDKNKPTRIMVSGDGDGLGLLFQEVAKARALRYAENNPGDQVVLISFDDKELGTADELVRWGFKIEGTDKSTIDGKVFVDEASKFKKIQSIDIFSHSSAQYGAHLAGKANHINERTKGLEVLKPNFLKDSYVFLHGCNSGFYLAPFLSNLWGIPVAGSLTSTNFQKLHSDGNFYLIEEGYAPNSDWATTNTLSTDKETNCQTGTCERLKPDNTAYFGWWGQYSEGGLPFYKFFCAKNNNEDCTRVMAKTMLSHSLIINLKKTSTLEEYKKGVVDFLCPVPAKNSKTDLRAECHAKLEEALLTGDQTYNPFSRPAIECDFKGCKAEITCDKILFTGVQRPGTCTLRNDATSTPTTLVREYKAYLQGYNSLTK
ncbi:MAG: hypothetical protein H7336_05200 [Bacteriovorax sp.]|nr:hypothetical protein [Bacteriovorax sp.]